MRSIDVGSRLIIGVGRNYAQHAKELNNAVPTSPILVGAVYGVILS